MAVFDYRLFLFLNIMLGENGCVFALRRYDGTYLIGRGSLKRPSKEIDFDLKTKEYIDLVGFIITSSSNSLIKDLKSKLGIKSKNCSLWFSLDKELVESTIRELQIGQNSYIKDKFPEWYLDTNGRRDELFSNGSIVIPMTYMIKKSLFELNYHDSGAKLNQICISKLRSLVSDYCGFFVSSSELKSVVDSLGIKTTRVAGGYKCLFYSR